MLHTDDNTVVFDQTEVPVIWRSSQRTRRLSARIDPRQRALLVTHPPSYPRTKALLFLKQQKDWILEHFEKLSYFPGLLTPGQVITLCDMPYTIIHDPEAQGGAWLTDTTLVVTGQPEFTGRRITDFLKNYARKALTLELQALSHSQNMQPSRLDIRDTKSRWGSCNSQGRIMLSWRLVLTPAIVRHYLMAHELSHLKHMNHSSAFWHLTDTLTPHRKEAEAWLKHYGAALMAAG
ncbi:M48 family metallopeptidase [Acetobacter thailandicus]|uniref:M48 family metallopeptidase n=1 Tax=Acetobacter thailandicus TaxID=1502842 RepID=UPI0031FEB77A